MSSCHPDALAELLKSSRETIYIIIIIKIPEGPEWNPKPSPCPRRLCSGYVERIRAGAPDLNYRWDLQDRRCAEEKV